MERQREAMAAAAAQGQGQLMIYIPGDGAPRLAYAPSTVQVREQVRSCSDVFRTNHREYCMGGSKSRCWVWL